MSETDPLPPRPATHWWPALVAMILCCMPCGIIALVSAYQVSHRWLCKNYSLKIYIIICYNFMYVYNFMRSYNNIITNCSSFPFCTAQAEDHYDRGDYAGAVKLSKRAVRWTRLTVLANAIYIIFIIIYFVIIYYIRMHQNIH